MPSCECCWNGAWTVEDYYAEMAAHEKRGCECTKPTPEGARLRAGRFWDEARKADTREDPPPETAEKG